jgi:heme a synthase
MEIERRRRLVQATALCCLVLVLAVTTLSAFVRLSNSGPGCEPWPQCFHERPLAGMRQTPEVLSESDAVLGARGAHRAAASSALLMVIALVALSLGPRPYLVREGRHALALLALVAFLAVLGRWSGGAAGPAVLLGNLLGGFLLFALCWRMALPESPPPSSSVRPIIGVAVVLVTMQAGLGVLGHPAHRFGAVAVLLVVVFLGIALWRDGRRALAIALVALLSVQGALGVAQFHAGLPLAMLLAHNVIALLLLATLLRVAILQWLGDGALRPPG